MAGLPAEEHRRWEAEAEAAVAWWISRQASTVAGRLRFKVLVDGEWYDDGDEWAAQLSGVLVPVIGGAAGAGGGAIVEGWVPDDVDVASRADLEASLMASTSERRFRQLVADAEDQAEAADAIAAEGTKEGRAKTAGVNIAVSSISWGMLTAARDDGGGWTKTWHMSPGHEGVDDCDSNSGQTVDVEDLFEGGVDAPPQHIGCNCYLSMTRILPAKHLSGGEVRAAAALMRRFSA